MDFRFTMARPQISFTRTKRYCDHVADKLDQISNDEDFTDFNLTVKGVALPCHKLTLAVHSPVFHAMLRCDMSEAAKQSFSLDHVPLEIVRKILKFMYVGEISFDTEHLIDLLKASDYLQMEVLKEMCIGEVSGVLEPDNVISWLEVATKLDLAHISSMCIKIMVSNFAEVSSQQEFLALESTEIQQYFTEIMNIHDIDHDCVLYLIMSWADHDPQNRLTNLENLLHIVELTSCFHDAILKPHNVMSWLEVATKLDLAEITSVCATIIFSNFEDVSHEPEFLALDSIKVQQYFTEVMKVRDTDHDNVLYLLMSWANHDTENRITDLENLLQIVELNNCSRNVIVDVMDKHGTMIMSNMNIYKQLTKTLKQTQKPNLMSVPAIGGPEFLALDFIKVQQYFTGVMKEHDTDHDSVLYSTMSWASHDTENRITHLENLLQIVPLNNCSPDAIVDVMDQHGAMIVSNMNVYKQFTKSLKQTQKPKFMSVPAIVGGQVFENVKHVVWTLDKSRKFVELCDLPSVLTKRHSACKCPQGFAVTGGENSDICIIFNASTKSWSTLQKMPTKRHRHGSLCLKNVLYVIGGGPDGAKSASVDYLLLNFGNWQRGVDLPIAVQGPLVAGINNTPYLLDAESTKQLLKFDLKRKMWDKLASLPVDRACWGVSMTAVNSAKLCVAGGLDKICAWYSTATDTWSIGQALRKEHNYGSLLVHDHTLLILGGRYHPFGTDEVEELDLADGSWSVSNIKMPASLIHHHAIVLDIPQQD